MYKKSCRNNKIPASLFVLRSTSVAVGRQHFLYKVYWRAVPADQPEYNANDNNLNKKRKSFKFLILSRARTLSTRHGRLRTHHEETVPGKKKRRFWLFEIR